MTTETKLKPMFYVSKVTPTPSTEQDQLDSSGEIENSQVTMEGSMESKKSCDSHVTSNSQDSCDDQVASKTKGQSTHVESTVGNTIRIEVPTLVNGHPTPNDQSPSLPLSSSSSRVSGVGSPTTEEGSTSSSSLSLLSQDQRYASREALIEQLQADLCNPSSDASQSRPGEKDIITQLLEHIVSLKMEIETLREENKQLHGLRTTMDDELHTLTENLFEEAYKMVDEAKGGKVTAEKRLADAAGKIDAMETEMSALKNLLHVPGEDEADEPRHTLSPSPSHKHHRHPSVKKALRKLSKRSGSAKGSRSKSSSSASVTGSQATPPMLLQHRSGIKGESLVEGEISPFDFQSFKTWLEGLSTSVDHPYLAGIIEVDVQPCLKFHTPQISEQVLVAVRENNLLMETLPTQETRRCALSGDDVVCTHRLKLGDSDDWHYISQWCRDRIAAACDFYMYIGHIQKGIVKLDATKLYWQVCRLRAMMSLTRLSLKLPE